MIKDRCYVKSPFRLRDSEKKLNKFWKIIYDRSTNTMSYKQTVDGIPHNVTLTDTSFKAFKYVIASLNGNKTIMMSLNPSCTKGGGWNDPQRFFKHNSV